MIEPPREGHNIGCQPLLIFLGPVTVGEFLEGGREEERGGEGYILKAEQKLVHYSHSFVLPGTEEGQLASAEPERNEGGGR